MAPSIVVLVREDPFTSAKPVEALRIALGLSTGENPLTVIVQGLAVNLLQEDIEDIVDGEILEKYLPAVKQLAIPFLAEEDSLREVNVDVRFNLGRASRAQIASTVAGADRVLIF